MAKEEKHICKCNRVWSKFVFLTANFVQFFCVICFEKVLMYKTLEEARCESNNKCMYYLEIWEPPPHCFQRAGGVERNLQPLKHFQGFVQNYWVLDLSQIKAQYKFILQCSDREFIVQKLNTWDYRNWKDLKIINRLAR